MRSLAVDGCGHNNTLGGTCVSLDTAIKSLQREVADWPRRQWCSWRCHRGNMGHQLQELGWVMVVRGKGREVRKDRIDTAHQQTAHGMGVVGRHVFAGLASPVGFAMSDLCAAVGIGTVKERWEHTWWRWWTGSCEGLWVWLVGLLARENRQKETGIVTSTKKRDSSLKNSVTVLSVVSVKFESCVVSEHIAG
jgi:hypothetical protein